MIDETMFTAAASDEMWVDVNRISQKDVGLYSEGKLNRRKGTNFYLVVAWFAFGNMAEEGETRLFTNKRKAITEAKRWVAEMLEAPCCVCGIPTYKPAAVSICDECTKAGK